MRRVELRSKSSPEYLSSACGPADTKPNGTRAISHPSATSPLTAVAGFGPYSGPSASAQAGYQRHQSTRPNSVAIMSPLNQSIATIATDASGSDLNIRKPQLFGMRLLLDNLDSPSPCRPGPERVNLEDALSSLTNVLEDYQGKHGELQKLEQMVDKLDRLLKVSGINCAVLLFIFV